MVGGIWLCQRCLDAMAHHEAQPVVSTDNPDSLDALQCWLDGLRDRQQRPGKEPNQEPIQLTPLPPYAYPSVPGGRSTTGTPLPVQLVRDPEPVIVPETQVSHSPTRTRPLFPSRTVPEVVSEPVPFVRNPVQNPSPEPTPLQNRVEPLPEPEQADKNSGKNSETTKFHPNFSGQTPEHDPEQPSEDQPRPTTPLQPNFTTKQFEKRKKRGRKRAKDRNSEVDGVRQLFELLWCKGSRGVRFGHFYRGQLSDDMRSYYQREYINGANTKSAAEYRQWRKEWAANHAVKTA